LQAVIWDMDGVLLDSERAHFDCLREVFEQHHLAFDDSSLPEIFGMNSHEVVRRIGSAELPEEFIAQLIEEKDRVFRKRIQREARFLPGVRGWLERFLQEGIYQALASSSDAKSIDVILGALGARHFFSIILSGHDLPSKPHPQIFQLAAARLGVPPCGCLVIEDAIVGVKAAKAAGMTCLAVTTTHQANALHEADLVRASLADVRYDDIRGLFA